MPRLIQFEGRSIEVPDDFTDAEVATVLAGGSQPTPLPQPRPPEAPRPDTGAVRGLQLGAQGVGAGLKHAVMAPFDLMAGAQNLVTGGINKVFGTEIPYATPGSVLVDKAIDAAGIPVIDRADMTPKERLLYDINDYGTQALTMGGGMAAAAPARAASLAAGGKSKVGDAFLRPYFTDAPRTLVGDVAAGVGAGAANNYVDENKIGEGTVYEPLVKAGATMAGGIAGATTAEAGALAGRAVKATAQRVGDVFRGGNSSGLPVDPTTLKPFTRSQVDAASATMQGRASNPGVAAADIGDAAAYYRDNGLPVPTSGILSNDVGLQSAEAAARTRNRVPFIESDNKLRAAATEKVGSMVDPGADQGAVPARAAQVKKDTLAPAQKAVSDAERSVADVFKQQQTEGAPLAAVANEGSKAGASQRLDKAVVDQGYIPARTQKNQMFEAAPGATQQVQADDVFAAAERVRAANNKLRPDSQIPEDLLSRIDKLVPKMETQTSPIVDKFGRPIQREVNVGGEGTALGADLADTRKYIGTAIDKARAQGNFDMADSLTQLKAAINKSIENAPGYAEANKNYQQFADTYRPTPNDAGAKFTRQIDRDPGRGLTPPSQTAGRFLAGPEKAEALNRMITAAKSPAEGQKAVGDYLRSDFASAAMNPDGTVNPRRAAAWMNHNADVLGQFPQSQREITDIATRARQGVAQSEKTQAALKAAKDTLGQTEMDFERSAAATLLKKDPRDVASEIFSGSSYGSEKTLDDITKLVKGDPQAERGWKAAVSEVLRDKVTGTAKIDAGGVGTGATYRAELGKLDKLFKDNEALLAKVYTPEEMNTLRQAHKLLEPLKKANVQATAGSQSIDKLSSVLNYLEAPIRAVHGALEGGSIMRKLRVMASMLPNDRQTVERLAEMAWFDPEVAQFLLKNDVKGMNAPNSSTRLKVIMSGAAASRASGPDE